MHAEFYFSQNLPCLKDSFRKAVLKGGVPESTYWDNGKVYQSRQMQLVAARLGTQVIFATPYAPEGNNYPNGINVSDEEMEALPIMRHAFHTAWNYTIQPGKD